MLNHWRLPFPSFAGLAPRLDIGVNEDLQTTADLRRVISKCLVSDLAEVS